MDFKNNIHKIKHHELTFEALFEAYFDCRKRKRSTFQSMEFEFEFEKNLLKLYRELLDETYEIGQSICFVVTIPKPREVWAGAFRDRVVHHLIYNAVKERFETRFIQDTFSCIPSRGTSMATKKAARYAKAVSSNYKERAYYVRMDIANFFNSIDKEILYKEILKYTPEPWLQRLIKKVVFNDPTKNPYIKSPPELFALLPKQKSLFNIPHEKGLPIGNLTSQFFSNVYLNPLDQFAKHKLKCKYYCRYVDDIIIFDKDPKVLNHAYAQINKFLKEKLAMELSHRKKVMNTVCKGFDFVGHLIKPNRTYLRTTIIKNSFRTIKAWRIQENRFSDTNVKKFVSKINSYLGMFKHVNGYNLRKKICLHASTLFTLPSEDFSKMVVAKEKPPKKPLELKVGFKAEDEWHLRHKNWESCPSGWKDFWEIEEEYSIHSQLAGLDNV